MNPINPRFWPFSAASYSLDIAFLPPDYNRILIFNQWAASWVGRLPDPRPTSLASPLRSELRFFLLLSQYGCALTCQITSRGETPILLSNHYHDNSPSCIFLLPPPTFFYLLSFPRSTSSSMCNLSYDNMNVSKQQLGVPSALKRPPCRNTLDGKINSPRFSCILLKET